MFVRFLVLVAFVASVSALSCPTPTISLTSATAHAGDTLVAQVTGLVPQSTYFFILGRPTLTPLLRLTGQSDETGAATVKFTLPADKTQPANYTASVACRCDTKTVSGNTLLTVTAATDDDDDVTPAEECPTPTLRLDTASARANSVVMALVSTGVASELPFTVRIARPRLAPLLTVQGTTDALGNAKVTLHIPGNAPSDLFMVGVTVNCKSGQFAFSSSPLNITNPHYHRAHSSPAVTACAAPTLALSSASVAPGKSVQLGVTGAPASVTLTVRVMLQGLPRSPLLTAQGTTGADGSASIALNFPSTAATGQYNVFVLTPCSGGQPVITSTPIAVAAGRFPYMIFGAPRSCPSPQLTLSSSSVVAGTSFKIHVASLPANAAVIVRVAKRGLSPLVTLPFTADASGTLDAVINVPGTAPAGAYGVGATTQCDGSPLIAGGAISITSA